MKTTVPNRAAGLALGVGLVLLYAARLPAQVAPSNAAALRAAAAMRSAESALQSGNLRGAAQSFALVLELASPNDTPTRARAHYGRALAAQRLLAGADTLDAWTAAGALADYDEARTLDSARFFALASNNAAVLLRASGDVRRAASYFLAASGDSALRPQALANAGRAFEAAGDTTAAADVYRRAKAGGASAARVDAALLRLDGATPAESLVAVVTRWAGDPANADRVPNAVVRALADERWGARQSPVTDSLVVLLASHFAAADVPPEWFAGATRAGLTRVAESNPYLRDCLTALLDAYRVRASGDRYAEAQSVDWWRGTLGRQRAWSRMLRSLGETHERAGRTELAASYYAAAIGFRYANGTLEEVRRMPHDAVDYNAALSLALILAHRDDGAALDRIEAFENFVFNEKSAAYSSNDRTRIRLFHQALGALYAARGQWNGPGARSARFQLDRMRNTTRELARDEPGLVDPPELLESLARAYVETGEPRRALGVVPDLARSYERFGWPKDSAQVLTMLTARLKPTRTVVTVGDAPAASARWQQWDGMTWTSSEGTGAARVRSFTVFEAAGALTVDGVLGTRLMSEDRKGEAFVPNDPASGALVLRRPVGPPAGGGERPWVVAGRVRRGAGA